MGRYLDYLRYQPQPIFTAVGYWPLGEATGNARNEAQRAALADGTYNGTTTRGLPGPVLADMNWAVKGNGSTGYVNVASDADLDIVSVNLTCRFWVKMTNANALVPLVTRRQSASPFEQWSIYQGNLIASTSTKQLSFTMRADASNRFTCVTTADFADGKWHSVQCGFYRAGQTIFAYVDGKAAAVTTSTSGAPFNVDPSAPLRVFNDNATSWSDATVAHLEVIRRLLLAVDARNYHAAGMGIIPNNPTVGLVI